MSKVRIVSEVVPAIVKRRGRPAKVVLSEGSVSRMELHYLKSSGIKGFSFLAGINRPLKPKQIAKLSRSIALMGVIRPVVVTRINFITGAPTDYILDGQNLYSALIKIGADIPYVKVAIKDKRALVEAMALLNASSTPWTMIDYITAWGSISDDYVFLNTQVEKYRPKLEVRVVMDCFMPGAKRASSVMLKRGDFSIADRRVGVKLLNQLADCSKIIPHMDRFSNRQFYDAALLLMKTMRTYKHDVFLTYLKKNKTALKFITEQHDEMLQFLKKAFK